MPTFITVATFNFPSEMHSARALLETEGIGCFVKDELTAQVHNFYSQAIGGVKLQVKEADAERAKRLLIQAGYIKEEKHELSGFWKGVDKLTRRVPWINKFGLEVRLFILVAILLFMISVGYFIHALINDKSEKISYLQKGKWCVSHVSYDNRKFQPVTDYSGGFLHLETIGCSETISLSDDGRIYLPGFESRRGKGSYEFKGGKLFISEVDTFGYVYNGIYDIEGNTQIIQLKAETTTIYCFKDNSTLIPF